MFGQGGGDFAKIDRAAKKLFKRSGFAAGDAAGNDQVEVAQIRGNIVGETVRSNPAAEVYADSTELFGSGQWPRAVWGRRVASGECRGMAYLGFYPDACLARFANRGDAVIGACADHHLFEHAH